MSSISPPATFDELRTDLMNRVRADTTTSTQKVIAGRYINIALQDMHLGFGEKLPWAERTAFLRTHPGYSTGTVTLNQSATAATGSSTLWDTNNVHAQKNVRTGGRMVFGGTTDIYDVGAVTNDTAILINPNFIGDDLSGATYTYFEDEYDLDSDFLKPIDLQLFSSGGYPIPLISRQEFRRRFSLNRVTGRPVVATLIDREDQANASNSPLRRVRFAPPPDNVYVIPYTYVTSQLAINSAGTTTAAELSADADVPIVPLRYRHAIVFHALYHWYRDRSDDQRSQEAKAEYIDIMLRITADQDIGAGRPQFVPRVGAYSRRARNPWSRVGRFDIGNRFDSIR